MAVLHKSKYSLAVTLTFSRSSGNASCKEPAEDQQAPCIGFHFYDPLVSLFAGRNMPESSHPITPMYAIVE